MQFELVFKQNDVIDQLGDPDSFPNFEAMKNVVEKFVEHGEYITIEFDSVIGSARVVKN